MDLNLPARLKRDKAVQPTIDLLSENEDVKSKMNDTTSNMKRS